MKKIKIDSVDPIILYTFGSIFLLGGSGMLYQKSGEATFDNTGLSAAVVTLAILGVLASFKLADSYRVAKNQEGPQSPASLMLLIPPVLFGMAYVIAGSFGITQESGDEKSLSIAAVLLGSLMTLVSPLLATIYGCPTQVCNKAIEAPSEADPLAGPESPQVDSQSPLRVATSSPLLQNAFVVGVSESPLPSPRERQYGEPDNNGKQPNYGSTFGS
ncbi:MAG: hypothetical protein NTU49_11160 [Gammaproteobacteria bacterium]|nr:hypothetical protein [Gammaproteobacteria bacterium]